MIETFASGMFTLGAAKAPKATAAPVTRPLRIVLDKSMWAL
jgi:hypothetical protein